MDKKLKAKWVKALVSGKYKQGEKRLYKSYEDSFCCLGVLAHLDGFALSALDGCGLLVDLGMETLGIDEQEELAQLNDSGVPFEMIAGLIQEAL